ncbi:MAG: ParB N-terminal domain-containing protein [Alphaproteobacteria bacterium]
MPTMMKPVNVMVEEIYVPVKFRDQRDAAKVEELAESIIEEGLRAPISVRRDKDRYVLVSGYHRLEAMRRLGEREIQAYLVAARQH